MLGIVLAFSLPDMRRQAEYLSILSDTYFLLDVKLAGGRYLPVNTALLLPTVEIH